MDDSDDVFDIGDSSDHSPPDRPMPKSRRMDAPFIVTAIVVTLLLAAFIFIFVR